MVAKSVKGRYIYPGDILINGKNSAPYLVSSVEPKTRVNNGRIVNGGCKIRPITIDEKMRRQKEYAPTIVTIEKI